MLRASSAACLWMLFWASQRGMSLTAPLHCTFEVSCLVLGWGLKRNMRQGLPANRLRQELRCTWLRKGLEHSWGWEMRGRGKSSNALRIYGLESAWLGEGNPHSAC